MNTGVSMGMSEVIPGLNQTIRKEVENYYEIFVSFQVGSLAIKNSDYIHLKVRLYIGEKRQHITIPINRNWVEQGKRERVLEEVKMGMFLGLRNMKDTPDNRKTYRLLYE